MKKLIASSLIVSLLLAGCGGGGNNENESAAPVVSSDSTTTPIIRSTVIGPLTDVQSTITNSVMQPLVVASGGTPLAGVVSCANSALGGDALNIINAVAKGQQGLAQNPQAMTNMAPQIQIQILQMARDMQQMIAALAGGAACGEDARPMPPNGNPLTGTPMAALGDQLLPVLINVLNARHSDQPSLTDVANQLLAISNAYNSAYRQLPASVVGAKVPDGVPALATRMIEVPVLGGVLSAFNSMLPALTVLIQSAAQGDTEWVVAMLENTTYSVIENLLLNVLPLNNLQAQSGSTVLSDPIHQAAEQIGAQLSAGLNSSVSEAAQRTALNNELAPVLATLNQSAGAGGATLLTSLLARLTAALAALPPNAAGSAAVMALIDAVLPAINSVLSSILGMPSSTSTTSAAPGCPLEQTELSVLCSVS